MPAPSIKRLVLAGLAAASGIASGCRDDVVIAKNPEPKLYRGFTRMHADEEPGLIRTPALLTVAPPLVS
jgi:hypothetical protein